MMKLVVGCAMLVWFPSVTVFSQDQVENPLYKNWAKFPAGSSVVYKSETTNKTTTIKQVSTYQLVELTDKKAVVRIQIRTEMDGKVTENEPNEFENIRYITLPPGIKKEDFGKETGILSQGEEEVKLVGRTFQAKWTKVKNRVEAGDTFTQTWSSPEVPGGLLKSESKTPATNSVTRLELAEMDINPKR